MSNPKVHHRILTISDASALIQFIASQKPLFGKFFLPAHNIRTHLENPNHLVIGTFVADQLCGTVAGVRWEHMPYFTVTRLFLDSKKFPGQRQFYQQISNTIGFLVRQMLLEKRTGFYHMLKKSHVARKDLTRDQSLLSEFDPIFKMFSFSIDWTLEKGEEPKFPLHQQMLVMPKAEFPVVFRRATLRTEYYKSLYLDAATPSEGLSTLKLEDTSHY